MSDNAMPARSRAKGGRPFISPDGAWSVPGILKKSREERGKLSQEAWQELEVQARKMLRSALHARGADRLPARSVKEIAVAAQICATKAYPEQAEHGMPAHAPARLLKAVSEMILRSTPQPVDVTPCEEVPDTIPTVAFCPTKEPS